MPTSPGPLQGVTVLDLTNALAGPFATLLLAGLGAQVIKIEQPGLGDPSRNNAPYAGRDGVSLTRQHPDDMSVSALNRLRGKLSITLNLKAPGAREVFADLVTKADVLVENFSIGTMDRLGLGYAFVRTINSRLVYCAIAGFGADRSTGSGKAMDTIIQALSGLMYTSGGPSDPPMRVGVPIADMTAPLFGVIGILAALREAERSGRGQMVDVSMLGALTALVAAEPLDLLERCGVPQRTGLTVPRLAPFGLYQSRNGHVAICAPTETFAQGVFAAIEQPALSHDPRFATRDQRVQHEGSLNAAIEAYTSTRDSADLVTRFERCGVPIAEVRSPSDAVRDWRVVARGETETLAHPIYGKVADMVGMGLPIRFSESTTGFAHTTPALGEHNDFVYAGILGYDSARLRALRADNAI